MENHNIGVLCVMNEPSLQRFRGPVNEISRIIGICPSRVEKPGFEVITAVVVKRFIFWDIT
jgi:hypothetical protein